MRATIRLHDGEARLAPRRPRGPRIPAFWARVAIAMGTRSFKGSCSALCSQSSFQKETILMLAPLWLLTIGIITGFVTRTIVGGKAYGAVADALLGITGAFAADWLLGVLTHTTFPSSNSTLLTIWGAAALPLLARFSTRRQLHGACTAPLPPLVCSGEDPSRTDR